MAIPAIAIHEPHSYSGALWFKVDCTTYDTYATLPRLLLYRGQHYGLSGWNSDVNFAYYSTRKAYDMATLPGGA